MAKRGRPIKPNARRNRIDLRMTSEEYQMLNELSEMTGRCRTDVIVDIVKKLYDDLKEKENRR